MAMARQRGFVKTLRYNIVTTDKVSALLDNTVSVYKEVVTYYLHVFQENLHIIDSSQWLRMAEMLTHQTKSNPNPKYDYDSTFPHFPSGLRRAAISDAYGLACSWQTNYKRWQKRKQKIAEKNIKRLSEGKKPVRFREHPPLFPTEARDWPTYYDTECRILDEHHILLKVYTGKAYARRKVALFQPMVIPEGYEAGSPKLILKPNGWQLHIPVFLKRQTGLTKVVNLINDPDTRICCVDLGINRHAVMTIQDVNGRVLATRIISGKQDNHRRKRYLEKISRLQKQTKMTPEGQSFAKDLWTKVRNFNNNIAHQVSRQIVDFAKQHGVKIIVFEYLTNLRPENGTRSRRLNRKMAHWVKGRIFRYTQYKGLHTGIVTCRVSPKNTSARCPYCGMLTIERYSESGHGVDLARCSNCGIHGVNSDFVGSYGIGTNFRVKHL
jgi:putative transposase